VPRQVELFRSMVVSSHPQLFKENVVGRSAGTEPFSLDSRLREWLPDLPRRIEIMRRLTHEIESNLRGFDDSFRRAFPSFAWRGKVYFTVSLDAFDGTVRKVEKEMALLFGVDKIAKIHGAGASLEPLFHHELFHVHHGAITPQPEDDRTLLYPLWNEGLAVFVAKKLHPHASWQQLVLSDEMVRRGAEQLPRLACELRPHLKGSTEAAFRDFFMGAGKRSDIPNRVGYYVGLRVVQEVARARSVEELARLRGKELFIAVDGALARLAGGRCTSPPSSGIDSPTLDDRDDRSRSSPDRPLQVRLLRSP